MIEVEIEDGAWTATLPDAETLVVLAAKAALSSPSCGDRSGEGVSAGPRQILAPAPPPSQGAGDVTILLSDDEAVQRLNAQFRGKPAPTNVLSFPAPATAAPHLGDIVLAYGVCAREAEAQGKPLAHHLMHLTAHGVLHLLGYDHETDADAEVMEALERDILAGLAVPDPYASESPAPDKLDVPV